MPATVIVGGGVIGLSVAYHLGGRGARDVVLLERNQLTSGTSWHAAGIVGPLRATPNMTRLASHALDLFPALEGETGLSTGYRRTGGYWLAREPDRMAELHRIADLGATLGLSPAIVEPADVAMPGLDLSGHVGALHVPEDGNVNPVDLCMAYARAARANGVEIHEGVTVQRVLCQEGRATGVALSDGTKIDAETVVLCAGAWSGALARTAGLALPLQAVEHMYVVTEPIADLPDPVPVIRDLDRGIYLKGDAGKLVIGGFEPDAKCWDPDSPEGDRPFLELAEDWDQFAPFMTAALDLMPGLASIGIQHFMNGPESFTNDTRPLVGAAPGVDGLFVAAGMNSVGVMSSAGIGRALADWILDRHPSTDLWEVDIARADPAAASADHMAERMREAVADLFALHWPYKQPRHGRGLRRSVLHDRWADAGAVFGQTAGWERGLLFAADDDERALPYATGAQPWWPIAAREAAHMQSGAVLLDLSPMTKLRLEGPGCFDALNRLTCRAIPNDSPNRIWLAPLLNGRGGIEVDATITALGPTRARVVTPAATRWRDRAYLRRALAGSGVSLTDETEDFVILGLMGAGSRDQLQQVCDTPLPDCRFGDLVPLTCAGQPIHAQRMSFVGELGFELWIPADAAAGVVFDALRTAGARPMGLRAVDGCRLEKGFLHWGHDIGPTVTPLQAGLGWTIDWTKDFRGKAALERQRRDGVTQRLQLFDVEGGPLLLHDEPVCADGRHVGYTTSGARGPRTGRALAMGLVEVAPFETPAQTCARQFSIRVAGREFPARALPEPPFDPGGKRMRA